MSECKKTIGSNIREVRHQRGLSQEVLAGRCGFTNTMLSAYENDRNSPGLQTLAALAKELNVTIDRLYYGDENCAFINSESNDGKKIVNSIYLLWSLDVIRYCEGLESNQSNTIATGVPGSNLLLSSDYIMPIRQFLNALNEFKLNRDTYPDPDQYLEILKASAANKINDQIRKQSKKAE